MQVNQGSSLALEPPLKGYRPTVCISPFPVLILHVYCKNKKLSIFRLLFLSLASLTLYVILVP